MEIGSHGVVRAARERPRRFLIVLAAAMVLAFEPLDVYVRGGFTRDLLALRVTWALVLLGIAWSQTRVTPRSWELLIALGSVASSAFYLAVVRAAGGLGTPQAVWLPVMPLATVILAWERVGAVVVAGLVTLAGTVLLALDEGAGGAAAVVWGSLVTGTVVLAAIASLASGMAQRAEAAALAARDDAQARLGESEHRRQRAERLAAVGRLAAGVAHEVNSPLSAARSNLALLREELEAPGAGAIGTDLREALTDTVEVVERIARIIWALRLFGEGDRAPDRRTCAVKPAIAKSLRAAEALLPANTALRADVEDGLPFVGVGDGVLAQIVLGLLLGAGNTLRPAGRGERPEVAVVARREGGGVRIEVIDNGTGLAVGSTAGPDLMGAGGHFGAGLTLARDFVELEGGRLEAANRPEGGARYGLWLPVAGGSGSSAAPP